MVRLICFALVISIFFTIVYADRYHISITTKRRTGQGRVADVCMALFDEVGDFQLSFCPLNSFKSSFHSGMEDNFYMMGPNRTKGRSGRLCQLAIRYSKGNNIDGWNVKDVQIWDRTTGESFEFHVSKLLKLKKIFLVNNCTRQLDDIDLIDVE